MMIKPETTKEAKRIGDDSWELQHFTQLPKNASNARQIEALKMDADWLENHIGEITSAIDRLVFELENEEERAHLRTEQGTK